LRISQLVRNCKLICGTSGNDLAVWRADDNENDEINPRELVYIEVGSGRNYVRFLDFPSADNWRVTLSDILGGTAKQSLILICDERLINLVPECSNVQIVLDTQPPWTNSVNMSFDLAESGVVHQYQISTVIRGWAGHLLDAGGDSLVSDDD
jgi:hypothetical protein